MQRRVLATEREQIAWQSPFQHVLRRQLRMDHDCCGSLVCYNCLHSINNCNFPLMLKHVLRRQLRMESRLFWFPSLLQLFTCYKLGINRVPTSKSCVFCLGIKFLFFPIWPFLGPFLLQGLFSWKGVMYVTFYEVAEESHFPDSVWWLYKPVCKSVKCLERIKSALKRKRSGILSKYYPNPLSVRFHIVDKYLHSFIVYTSFQISRGFLLSDWKLEWFAGPSETFPRICDVRHVQEHVGILVHFFILNSARFRKKWCCFLFLCRSL